MVVINFFFFKLVNWYFYFHILKLTIQHGMAGGDFGGMMEVEQQWEQAALVENDCNNFFFFKLVIWYFYFHLLKLTIQHGRF